MSDLDRSGWRSFARDLLLATNEPLFTVLSMPGAPYRGAHCGHDATIDILEVVLDHEEDVLVLYPSGAGGFHFDVSNKEYSAYGDFSVEAWGEAALLLAQQVDATTCTWHAIPGDNQ